LMAGAGDWALAIDRSAAVATTLSERIRRDMIRTSRWRERRERACWSLHNDQRMEIGLGR
jgi:hypothetical protein